MHHLEHKCKRFQLSLTFGVFVTHNFECKILKLNKKKFIDKFRDFYPIKMSVVKEKRKETKNSFFVSIHCYKIINMNIKFTFFVAMIQIFMRNIIDGAVNIFFNSLTLKLSQNITKEFIHPNNCIYTVEKKRNQGFFCCLKLKLEEN